MRWVLGEQSAKQLRGASMQDVIFAGTENRKPLSYAYVAITMDNSDHQLAIDFEEVTVARRVYRSGEERVSDQRKSVQTQGCDGAFLRHRYRQGGVLHHRTGTDRAHLKR